MEVKSSKMTLINLDPALQDYTTQFVNKLLKTTTKEKCAELNAELRAKYGEIPSSTMFFVCIDILRAVIHSFPAEGDEDCLPLFQCIAAFLILAPLISEVEYQKIAENDEGFTKLLNQLTKKDFYKC